MCICTGVSDDGSSTDKLNAIPQVFQLIFYLCPVIPLYDDNAIFYRTTGSALCFQACSKIFGLRCFIRQTGDGGHRFPPAAFLFQVYAKTVIRIAGTSPNGWSLSTTTC